MDSLGKVMFEAGVFVIIAFLIKAFEPKKGTFFHATMLLSAMVGVVLLTWILIVAIHVLLHYFYPIQ